MKKLILAALAAVSLTLGATPASAALIVSGGGGGVLDGSYNPNGTPVASLGDSIRIGSVLSIVKWSVLSVEYIGKEAGFNNRFAWNGTTLVWTDTTAPGTSFGPFDLTGANYVNELPFGFGLDSAMISLMNESGRSAGQSPNIAFRVLVDGSVLVFLDDGGAGPDRDFDDAVLRISVVSEVPEPSMIALIGLVLLLLGYAATRRSRSLEA